MRVFTRKQNDHRKSNDFPLSRQTFPHLNHVINRWQNQPHMIGSHTGIRLPSDPHLIGHELLHLFGLVDRYMMLTRRRSGQVTTELVPTRPTGGRKDPLGGEHGKILIEDLAFLFDKLGVYKLEEIRGLDTLKRLEAQGMTFSRAMAEIHRLKEIIKHGRDPHSLLPIRGDYRQEILDSVRNLPK